MKWYWILAIVVGALLIGFGISIAINGGAATVKFKTPFTGKTPEDQVNATQPEVLDKAA